MRTIVLMMGLSVVCAALSAAAGTLYVWTNSPADGPGTAWTNAFHVIQDAVDAASDGDTVLVTNGTYDTGGALTPGYSLSNRVVIDKAVTVKSINGPSNTFIVGQGPLGMSAVRCAYLTNGAVLVGFTLTNGHTFSSGDEDFEQGGGGALLNRGGTISNCVVTDCKAQRYGGGVYVYRGGEVLDSELMKNTVYREGGGVRLTYGGEVNRCHIHDNLADVRDGGGVYVYYDGLVCNSLIEHNTGYSGAGVYLCSNSGDGPRLYNCTVVDNTADLDGGGVRCLNGGKVQNTIAYYNTANGTSFDNYRNDGPSISYYYTCTTPTNGIPGGTGCITNNPHFVNRGDEDYHLLYGSPCIDSGTNLVSVPDDLDGIARPLDGNYDGTNTTDMGCYEYDGSVYDCDGDGLTDSNEIFQTGTSPTNVNTDGDWFDDYQEWIADTDGTDSNDWFRITAVSNNSPVTVYFESSSNRQYTLYGIDGLVDGVWTNVPGAGPRMGAGGSDSMTDTNEPARGPFYRLEVRKP